ncbi:hypothetical protein [Couchioplanes azureus]|uniref:hypothetical protein n=2 Tax=Couchioplanes caeruleus TaxID=56438 RepID=UPI001E53B9E2|nr:hypothetical protein [Couchioplanes caeruleus]
MLVPMIAVSNVPVSFVQIVGVALVRDGRVAAPVAMDMLMRLRVCGVLCRAALLPVALCPAMNVTIVDIVGVVVVSEADVTALLTVLVVVLSMDLMLWHPRPLSVVAGSAPPHRSSSLVPRECSLPAA